MTRIRILALAASAFALVGCERSAQPATNAPPVQPKAAVTNAAVPASDDSDETTPDVADQPIASDTLVVSDTTGSAFTGSDVSAVKRALEARLHLDEFTANAASAAYATACRPNDTTSLRRYAAGDTRFAFVRPRVVKITLGGDHAVRLVNAQAEVTRIAVIRRDLTGKWRAANAVTRDTLSFYLRDAEGEGNWTVCEKPAHFEGSNGDGSEKPFATWLPVNAIDADRLGVVWEDRLTTAKVRQLADSVSKLPPGFVVEGNPEPKVPIVIKDICPGEGCEFGEWLTCDTLRVFTDASAKARTAFTLHRGDKFTAVTGDVHITQAGKVVFTRNKRVDVDNNPGFVFTPADTLYPILYEGEGNGDWYFRGKDGGGDFFFGNGNADGVLRSTGRGYEIVRWIKSDWWVKVRAKDGREGWIVPNWGSIYGNSPHYTPMPDACPSEKRS
jgi:hypothetical protein